MNARLCDADNHWQFLDNLEHLALGLRVKSWSRIQAAPARFGSRINVSCTLQSVLYDAYPTMF